MKAIPSLSVQDAAVLTALDCLDELSKANQNIENIRTQIKDYVDDAGRARSQADEAQKEIRELQAKVHDLEEQLEARTVVKREPEDEVINANELLSQEIKNAIERPVHPNQPKRQAICRHSKYRPEEEAINGSQAEILAPCGSFETLEAALRSGCDAGLSRGREILRQTKCANFTDEQLKEAVRLCHLRGVKVYQAINTVVFDEQLEECKKAVKFAAELR